MSKTTFKKGRTPKGAPTNKKKQDFINSAQVGTASQASTNPLDNLSPKAPRKYKTITLQFNRYEFERLDDAVNKSGFKKSEFIRDALAEACDNTLGCEYDWIDENPHEINEPRTSKVDGKIKPNKTVSIQFNQHEWYEIQQAASNTKRSVISIIRGGLYKEINSIKRQIKNLKTG